MRDRTWFKNFFLTFFIIISILQIIDWVTTIYLINTIGIRAEFNPIVSGIISKYGSYSVLLFKTSVMLIYFVVGWIWVNHPILFYRKDEQIAFQVLAILLWIVYSLVVALNLSGIIYIGWYK